MRGKSIGRKYLWISNENIVSELNCYVRGFSNVYVGIKYWFLTVENSEALEYVDALSFKEKKKMGILNSKDMKEDKIIQPDGLEDFRYSVRYST